MAAMSIPAPVDRLGRGRELLAQAARLARPVQPRQRNSGILLIRMPEQMPESQPSPQGSVPRNTTALLGIAYMSLGHRIVEGVNAAGFPNRPAHSSVMAHIDIEGGTRLTTIAARANITPQAVGELVDDLERLGYVVRQPDPDDRRAKRVVLTRRGRESVVAAFHVIAALETELEELLGSEAVAALHDSLSQIVAAGGRSDSSE
jgi:DNA-binding MarR family transcriptional regulator